MGITSQTIYECLHYLLSGQSKPLDTIVLEDNTTYTFFQANSKDINYTLIQNENDDYFYLSVNSQEYTDTISLLRLSDNSLEKSQIFWDILEMGGIKYYSFQLLLKRGIPNNRELDDIDWSQVQR
jgi:hypothetical protein